jgi:Tfp pilus assembly protein PilO
VCDLDVTGTPSIFKIICSASALSRILTIFDFSWAEKPHGGSGKVHCLIVESELLKLQQSSQFPDEFVKIKVTQIHYSDCGEIFHISLI